MNLGNRSGQLPRDGRSLSCEIVVSIAEEKGVDPLELSPPLATAVDIESLERAIERSEVPIGVTFEYAGFAVEIRSDSTFTVCDVDHAGDG